MSVKKLLILAAAGVASTSAMAGGASGYSAPATSVAADSNVGLYVGVDAGYAMTGWKSASVTTVSGGSFSKNNGFVGGLNVGYSFNKNLALEVGGFYLPQTKYITSTTTKFKSWVGYVAGKGSIAVYDAVSVFGKLGVAYTNVKTSGGTTVPDNYVGSGSHHSYSPMFAAGLSYDFMTNWYADAQYTHIVGKSKNGTVYTTSPNMFTVGVGYLFAM